MADGGRDVSLPLTGSQSVFARLGAVFGLIESENTQRGVTAPPKVDALQAMFTSTDQDIIDGLYQTLSSRQGATSGYVGNLKSLAKSLLVRMVNDDLHQTSSTSLSAALDYLVAQMVAQSATVRKCATGVSSASAGTNAGNPVVAVGSHDADGRELENMFAETITGTCASDAQAGGSATPGRETFSFKGQYASSGDALNWDYPKGSGSTASVRCIDAGQNGGTGNQNWLMNGSFETFTTPNIPDDWVIGVGTAGTSVKKSTTHYLGTSSLNFVGDGSELTAVYQEFNNATTGTRTVYAPETQVAFNLFISTDTSPAAGVLEIALVDGSGAVILDNAGTPNLVTHSLTSVTSTWVPVTGFFRTPRVLPSVVRLRIRLSTAMTAAHNLYIDRAALARPTALYPGGPNVALFSASANSAIGDVITITITNDYAGKFQRYFERAFGMRAAGALLPSAASGSETIPDSLIA